jgi:hypothetical protein
MGRPIQRPWGALICAAGPGGTPFSLRVR